jgi:putative methylase
MQKRLIRKLDLEMFLSQIKPHPSPKPSLEQYTIPTNAAATLLYIAAYTYGDIVGKSVLDLGCGTGRLALGAAFLGASHVVGVDIDRTAVEVALENTAIAGFADKVSWIVSDIDAVQGSFDTVIQNPPYGVQKRGADCRFLEKALEVGRMVYSLHKNPSRDKRFVKQLKSSGANVEPVFAAPFIENFVEAHGGKVKSVYAMLMTVPHMFSFHTKRRHEFAVDLYVIKNK